MIVINTDNKIITLAHIGRIILINQKFKRKINITSKKRSNPCTYKYPEKFDITIIIQLYKLYDFNELYNYHTFLKVIIIE